MQMALWPDAHEDELRAGAAAFFAGRTKSELLHCVFPADAGNKPIGMLELSLRLYADGCDSSPVPFTEAWYVAPDARRAGVGGALVRAAEAWAMENGYTEMASDALLDNAISECAHAALGFEEVERAIRFRKELRR